MKANNALRMARYHLRMLVNSLGWPIVKRDKRRGNTVYTDWVLASPLYVLAWMWAKVTGGRARMIVEELDAAIDRSYERAEADKRSKANAALERARRAPELSA